MGGVAAYGAGLVKSTLGLGAAIEIAGVILLVSAFVVLRVPRVVKPIC